MFSISIRGTDKDYKQRCLKRTYKGDIRVLPERQLDLIATNT